VPEADPGLLPGPDARRQGIVLPNGQHPSPVDQVLRIGW
jgi:hypothetical protein